jgi:hypothetical protein
VISPLTVTGINPVIERAEHLARIIEVIIGWRSCSKIFAASPWLARTHAEPQIWNPISILWCSLLTQKAFVLMAHGSKPSITEKMRVFSKEMAAGMRRS